MYACLVVPSTRSEKLVPDESTHYTERVVCDPNILAGKPTIKGTRVPVALILNLLGHGMTVADITSEYPYVTEDDIRAALLYAEARIKGDDPGDEIPESTALWQPLA